MVLSLIMYLNQGGLYINCQNHSVKAVTTSLQNIFRVSNTLWVEDNTDHYVATSESNNTFHGSHTVAVSTSINNVPFTVIMDNRVKKWVGNVRGQSNANIWAGSILDSIWVNRSTSWNIHDKLRWRLQKPFSLVWQSHYMVTISTK